MNDEEAPSEEVEVQHSHVDTEVLFAKDNVFTYPSRNRRIGGRLTLVKQHCVVFLAWIPYESSGDGDAKAKGQGATAAPEAVATATAANDTEGPTPTTRGEGESGGSSRVNSNSQYALQPLPVSEIRYIRRHTPTLGWHYIVIVLKEKGVSLAPLFFHLGGVRKFLSTLKEHVALMRSEQDKNCYVVNEISEPIRRTLAPVQDPMDQQMLTGILQQHGTGDNSHCEEEEGTATAMEVREERERQNSLSEVSAATAGNVGSVLLDKAFSLSEITRRAYDQTAYFLQDWSETFQDNHFHTDPSEEPSGGGGGAEAGDDDGGEDDGGHGGHGVRTGSDGTDSPLSNSKLTPLDNKTLDTLHKKIQSTLEDGVDYLSTELGHFEFLDGDANGAGAEGGAAGLGLDCCLGSRTQVDPVNVQDFEGYVDSEGRFRDVDSLLRKVFEGGCSPSLRPRIYPFLLGYLDLKGGTTAREREARRRKKHQEYEQIKGQWATISEDQARRFSKYRERKIQIEKDIVRTDSSHLFFKGKMANENVRRMRRILLAYGFYNFDLGYCQGMSDLLAPLLYVIPDEADCFWCFVGLMDKMERNFDQDQSGMHNQLLALRKLVQLLDPQLFAHFECQEQCQNYLFCYRWLLLHFKREFAFDDCLRLWESLWTCAFCDQLHMYVCVAVLQQFRRKIIEADMSFDDLVLLTNELSYRIPLEESLRNAEILCKFAGDAGQQVLATIAPLE